jgi:hypothetical protein
MGRNRVDPDSAAEWLTKSKDLLMDLIGELLQAREAAATGDRRRRNAKSQIRPKTQRSKSTTRSKRARP